MRQIAKLRLIMGPDYWTVITAYYKQLPDYLTNREKWEQAYKHMREREPHSIPEIPQTDNTFVREYAMAIRALMIFRFPRLILSKDLAKGWK